MFPASRTLLALALLVLPFAAIEQSHMEHAPPQKLGDVSFPTSCQPAVEPDFDRAVALLHSFAYSAARDAFQSVASRDPACAMAHWGIAMSHFHQLWDPPLYPSSESAARREIELSRSMKPATDRERRFILAAASLFSDPAVAYSTRALNYEQSMHDLAADYPRDLEAQTFYALVLISNASLTDKTHARQKQAAHILEPLFRDHLQHPGIAHYLIHAYDNAELASRGLPAARAYSTIAASAPHALHMPSHIFTRLGLWEDSIASNIAAREAAHRAGDLGEELHAMDYLVYAYLQAGRDADAAQVIEQLHSMPNLDSEDFKVGYAATTMPVRYAVERRQWADAALLVPPAKAPPHVIAIAVWAQGLGLAHTGRAAGARNSIDNLQRLEQQLREAENDYWATQVEILKQEVAAWCAREDHNDGEAERLMRQAADQEDSIEKRPVTPGPIVPAREQLGEMLLEQGHPELAAVEFHSSLANAPARRNALRGAAESARATPQ